MVSWSLKGVMKRKVLRRKDDYCWKKILKESSLSVKKIWQEYCSGCRTVKSNGKEYCRFF